MQRINFAATRLVNPPGVTPVLTHDQLWKGLQIKARDPRQFFPPGMAKSCEVVVDNGNTYTRNIVFVNPQGKELAITEDMTEFEGTIIYFDSPDAGTRITNIISIDENDQLLLTFSFSNGIPAFVPPSPDAIDYISLNKTVGPNVAATLQKIRDLATAGEI